MLFIKDDWVRMSLGKAWAPVANSSSGTSVDFGLCASYPAQFFLPASVSRAKLLEVVSFRSSGRVPMLSWKHPFRSVFIARCSQPHVGVRGQPVVADVSLLEDLGAVGLAKWRKFPASTPIKPRTGERGGR